jgi:hypothetical protein
MLFLPVTILLSLVVWADPGTAGDLTYGFTVDPSIVAPGDTVHVVGTFELATEIEFQLQDGPDQDVPISLGTLPVDPDGALEGDLVIPSEVAGTGRYRLAALWLSIPTNDLWISIEPPDPHFTNPVRPNTVWYPGEGKLADGADCPSVKEEPSSLSVVIVSQLPDGADPGIVPGNPRVVDGGIGLSGASGGGEDIWFDPDDEGAWEGTIGLDPDRVGTFILRGLCASLLELTPDGTAIDPASLEQALFESEPFPVVAGGAHCGFVLDPPTIDTTGSVRILGSGFARWPDGVPIAMAAEDEPLETVSLGTLPIIDPGHDGNVIGDLPLPSGTAPGRYVITAPCEPGGLLSSNILIVTAAPTDPPTAPPADPVDATPDLTG